MLTACPVCGKDDAAQKVSAVVLSGKSSGRFSGPSGGAAYVGGKWGTVGGYTTLNGESASELARLLAAPEEPKKGWFTCLEYVLLYFGVMILLMGAVAFDLTLGLGWLIIGVIWLAIPIGRLAWRRMRYTVEKPAWDAAIKRWNRLYYCVRDDVVFNPQTGENVQPQSMQQYLYSGTGSGAEG